MAAALLCSAVSFQSFSADNPAAKTYPYRLSKKDLAELSGLACQTHGMDHDAIKAWSDKRGDRRNLRTSVTCPPHATAQNYALYYEVNCHRGDKWECKRSETRLRTTLDSRRVDIVTNGYKPELAYSLVSKIAAYRLPKGDPVLDTDTVQCALRKGPSKELLDITCNDKLIRLSYWCPQSSCPRIFWINGYFVPADAGGL